MDLQVSGTIKLDEKTKEILINSVKDEVRKDVLDDLNISALSSYIKETFDIDDFYELMKFCFRGEKNIMDAINKRKNDGGITCVYMRDCVHKLEAINAIINI